MVFTIITAIKNMTSRQTNTSATLKQFFWFSWVYTKTCKNLVLQYLKLLFIFLSAVDSDDDDEDDEDERLSRGLFEKKKEKPKMF